MADWSKFMLCIRKILVRISSIVAGAFLPFDAIRSYLKENQLFVIAKVN